MFFFLSPSGNLASPVRGEIFRFTRPVCGFLGATFTYPAYVISEKGNLLENLPTWRRFFRTPRENIDAIIGFVMERRINGKRQYSEYASSALFANAEPRELLRTKPLIFEEARVRFRHKHPWGTSWAGQFWQIVHTLSFQDIH